MQSIQSHLACRGLVQSSKSISNNNVKKRPNPMWIYIPVSSQVPWQSVSFSFNFWIEMCEVALIPTAVASRFCQRTSAEERKKKGANKLLQGFHSWKTRHIENWKWLYSIADSHLCNRSMRCRKRGWMCWTENRKEL